jgi:hypothetical protein
VVITKNCPIDFMFGGDLGFSIGLNVRAAFTRVANTAGTTAHTTYGENKSKKA